MQGCLYNGPAVATEVQSDKAVQVSEHVTLTSRQNWVQI